MDPPHYRRYWQPFLTQNLKLLYWNRFGDEMAPRKDVVNIITYRQLIDKLPHLGSFERLLKKAFPSEEEKSSISSPLLFFAAADDPFHPIDATSIDDTLPNVLYYITATGGHVSWPEGWGANCSTFHTRVVMEFFGAHKGCC